MIEVEREVEQWGEVEALLRHGWAACEGVNERAWLRAAVYAIEQWSHALRRRNEVRRVVEYETMNALRSTPITPEHEMVWPGMANVWWDE